MAKRNTRERRGIPARSCSVNLVRSARVRVASSPYHSSSQFSLVPRGRIDVATRRTMTESPREGLALIRASSIASACTVPISLQVCPVPGLAAHSCVRERVANYCRGRGVVVATPGCAEGKPPRLLAGLRDAGACRVRHSLSWPAASFACQIRRCPGRAGFAVVLRRSGWRLRGVLLPG